MTISLALLSRSILLLGPLAFLVLSLLALTVVAVHGLPFLSVPHLAHLLAGSPGPVPTCPSYPNC